MQTPLGSTIDMGDGAHGGYWIMYGKHLRIDTTYRGHSITPWLFGGASSPWRGDLSLTGDPRQPHLA
jgi:hypothetical protein